MTDYVFYRKQQVIATLERSDVERARLLMADGYSKMDEEINAASARRRRCGGWLIFAMKST